MRKFNELIEVEELKNAIEKFGVKVGKKCLSSEIYTDSYMNRYIFDELKSALEDAYTVGEVYEIVEQTKNEIINSMYTQTLEEDEFLYFLNNDYDLSLVLTIDEIDFLKDIYTLDYTDLENLINQIQIELPMNLVFDENYDSDYDTLKFLENALNEKDFKSLPSDLTDIYISAMLITNMNALNRHKDSLEMDFQRRFLIAGNVESTEEAFELVVNNFSVKVPKKNIEFNNCYETYAEIILK